MAGQSLGLFNPAAGSLAETDEAAVKRRFGDGDYRRELVANAGRFQ
jgi:hypothetical protein